jgi:hypothetical protein
MVGLSTIQVQVQIPAFVLLNFFFNVQVGIQLSFCATRDNGLQGKSLALLALETNMPVPAQLECLGGWMHCLIYELNSI